MRLLSLKPKNIKLKIKEWNKYLFKKKLIVSKILALKISLDKLAVKNYKKFKIV